MRVDLDPRFPVYPPAKPVRKKFRIDSQFRSLENRCYDCAVNRTIPLSGYPPNGRGGIEPEVTPAWLPGGAANQFRDGPVVSPKCFAVDQAVPMHHITKRRR